MTSFTTFYLSSLVGKEVFGPNGDSVGVIKDLLTRSIPVEGDEFSRQLVTGVKMKVGRQLINYSFRTFRVIKAREALNITCTSLADLAEEEIANGLFLVENVLDKQIVDLNGRKLVRVNDIRLVTVAMGTFAIAVDIGIEGLLRRIGIAQPLKKFVSLFKGSIPAKYILWEDVQAIDYSNLNIKLSKTYSRLQTLHPSDLADILEDLGKKPSMSVFSSLDEEQAADVLEELETHAQIHIVENLPVEKAADLLEKMPADEVADILDELEDEKAEILLNEMDDESSQEVRELLEYSDNSVGSIMTTDYLTFGPEKRISDVINEIRDKKPEPHELYKICVTDEDNELIGTFSLRDIVLAQPGLRVSQIMNHEPILLFDDQKQDAAAVIISKYSLLAVPVVDRNNQLQGMVIVDDVVEELMGKRRSRMR
jgi:CBS domain-containing protein